MKRRSAPLLSLLLALGALTLPASGEARVRLGDALPAHPWTLAEREVIVVYSHDCGDLGTLWGALLRSGLPVRAVNVSPWAVPAPEGVQVWRGEAAQAFARALRVGVYPAVVLVQGGRVVNAWEGTFRGQTGELD